MARTKKTSQSGANTISGLWKHIIELAPCYLDSKSKNRAKLLDKLKKMEKEANSSSIPNLIAENFVRPYLAGENENITVYFDGLENGAFADWTVYFIKEEKKLKVNPLGLFLFSKIFKDTDTKIKKTKENNDFAELRLTSFIKEVSKLPDQYMMFIGILKGIADTTQVCVSDNRNVAGLSDPHTALYLSLLWAVKQFEDFYQKIQNRNIRSDYCIIWHEGEWIESR